ncbi:MAG: hypothetical protein LBJ74_03925, partial [Heliobacteriaceae bacterium]|nr:hypothetical protein [Heliobacteriaceae bacterium]
MESIVQTHGMLISGLILLITYIFIASERVQKSVAALVGASVTLLLGLYGHHPVFEYVAFDVIFLLVGMMIIVHIAAASGVFKWLAINLLSRTKGSPVIVL